MRILRGRYRLKPEVCALIIRYIEEKVKKNNTITKGNILRIIERGRKDDFLGEKDVLNTKTVDGFIKDVHDKFERKLKFNREDKKI